MCRLRKPRPEFSWFVIAFFKKGLLVCVKPKLPQLVIEFSTCNNAISQDTPDNVARPRLAVFTIELIKNSFVLYHQLQVKPIIFCPTITSIKASKVQCNMMDWKSTAKSWLIIMDARSLEMLQLQEHGESTSPVGEAKQFKSTGNRFDMTCTAVNSQLKHLLEKKDNKWRRNW